MAAATVFFFTRPAAATNVRKILSPKSNDRNGGGWKTVNGGTEERRKGGREEGRKGGRDIL